MHQNSKSHHIYLTFFIIGVSIFLLEMLYFIHLFKKREWETEELNQVIINSGLSTTDFWVTQRAFLTRDSIIKLRGNVRFTKISVDKKYFHSIQIGLS